MRSRTRRPACGLGALGLLLCVGMVGIAGLCGPAHAQRAVDVQLLLPPAGRSAAISIPDLALPRHGTLRLAATGNYARRPWTRQVDCAPTESPDAPLCPPGMPLHSRLVLVPDMTQLELSAALALFESLQLGATLPFAIVSVVDDVEVPTAFVNRTGLGDLRLSLDFPIVRGDSALGVSLVVNLPSGDTRNAASAGSWSVRPALVAQQRVGPLRLSLAAAYRTRQRHQLADLDYDDELEFAFGVLYPWLGLFEARAEFRMRLGFGDFGSRAARSPAELDGALAVHATERLLISLGAGAAVAPGRRGYGAPSARAFATVSYEFGVVTCAFGPEDRDGNRDDDSCRDPDDDADGVPDTADACPNDPEDADGFEDSDGCPDSDNDADGMLDAADRCPARSEDRDGFEDDDGCPEPDNDGDGMLDALDACPLDPEDRDEFQDDDGCPEPGPTPLSVSIGERRILVSERIYFDDGRDTIREVSRPVLDQVAAVIRGMRSQLKVIVEGHTDDAGTPAYNLDLSHRRARAVVEYLRGRGIPPERLDYVGYGATRPLGPNDSPEGRALNRRVEFTLAP